MSLPSPYPLEKNHWSAPQLAILGGLLLSWRLKSKFLMTFRLLEIWPHFILSSFIIYYNLPLFLSYISLQLNRTSCYVWSMPCLLLQIEPNSFFKIHLTCHHFYDFFSWFLCASIALLYYLVLCSLILLICWLLPESKNYIPLIFVHPVLSIAISPWWAFNKYLMNSSVLLIVLGVHTFIPQHS